MAWTESKFASFISGFAGSTGMERHEADEAWAAYSRQLSDSERERIEARGAAAGRRQGKMFLKDYPRENRAHRVRRVNMRRVGWVAVDYRQGDRLSEVRHAPIRVSVDAAKRDERRGNYQGVRWVGSDGYLYVDAPEQHNPRNVRRVSKTGWIKAKAVRIRKVKGGHVVEVRR